MKSNNTISQTRENRLIILLRIISIVAALYQIFFGELVIGIYIVLATGAIMLPGFFTRNYIRSVPYELELIFSIMILLSLVIGETLDFYMLIPYYDKFIHFSLPFFVGLIAFLLAYTMYRTGNLRITNGPLIIIIVLITMGIGATWEIIEYVCDVFISPHLNNIFGQLQGSTTESPLVDTMNDLIFDMLGGMFGALLGLRYIESERKNKSSRLKELVNEISQNFGRKNNT